MAPLLRMSGLHRALPNALGEACSGPLLLPHVPSKSGRAAKLGTLAHLWASDGPEAVKAADPGEFTAPQIRKILDVVGKVPTSTRDRLWPPGGIWNVGVAINLRQPSAGLHFGLGNKDEFRASYSRDWLTGEIDFLESAWDGPRVSDLKTGSWDWVTPAKDSVQLKTYALGVYLARGRVDTEVTVDIVHLDMMTSELRLHSVYTWGADSLEDHWRACARLVDITEVSLTPSDGRCTWCPVDPEACRYRKNYK